jgi:hypothetical protein
MRRNELKKSTMIPSNADTDEPASLFVDDFPDRLELEIAHNSPNQLHVSGSSSGRRSGKGSIRYRGQEDHDQIESDAINNECLRRFDELEAARYHDSFSEVEKINEEYMRRFEELEATGYFPSP